MRTGNCVSCGCTSTEIRSPVMTRSILMDCRGPAAEHSCHKVGRRRAIASLFAAATDASSFQLSWKRTLGGGYSGIAVSAGVLYTMYRRGNAEVVTALRASNGTAIWEHAYDAPFRPDNPEAREGPHCTPIVAGAYLVTAGVTGSIHAYHRESGKLLWRKDLRKEFRATEMGYGYSSHPLPYKDSVIVMAGGHLAGLLRLRLSDGRVIWQAQQFKNSNSSPVLIRVDGHDQVVAYTVDRLLAVTPESGELLWSQDNPMRHGQPIVPPLWCPGNLLFVSSAYDGSRVLELHQSGANATYRQLWGHERARNYFGSPVLLQGSVLFTSGTGGSSLLTAVELRNGRILWQSREILRAQLTLAADRLFALEESGLLSASRVEEKGVKVLGKLPLVKRPARTPPALADQKLYLRDHFDILEVALK
jgi:outer membrane protein assembly factor BamB